MPSLTHPTTEQRRSTLALTLQQRVPLPEQLQQVVTDTQLPYRMITGATDIMADGKFCEFVTVISAITGKNKAALKETFVSCLEKLGSMMEFPHGTFYQLTQLGKLRSRDDTACGRGVILTTAGKNQILGWENDPISVAWRHFLLAAYQAHAAENAQMRQYLNDRSQISRENVNEHRVAVRKLTEQGIARGSAIGKVRYGDRVLYKALAPGFNAANQAVCVVNGKALDKKNLKSVSNRSITSYLSQYGHAAHCFLRNKTRVMQGMHGQNYTACARAVAQQALANDTCRILDMNGVAVSDLQQACIIYSAMNDFALGQGVQPQPPALPAQYAHLALQPPAPAQAEV